MPDGRRLPVVICWQFHLPLCRDLASGEPLPGPHPLSALRALSDLAAHLETAPDASCVVAPSPILLDALDDVGAQLATYLRTGAPLKDRALAWLTPHADRATADIRQRAVRHFVVQAVSDLDARFDHYQQLLDAVPPLLDPAMTPYVAPQLVLDLACWHHLAVLGETVRSGDPRVAALLERRSDYSAADARLLLEILTDSLAGLTPRLRRLLGSGRVEPALVPWAQPVSPLLFDFAVAQQAQPSLRLPQARHYPGGEDRLRWHLARAAQDLHAAFGVRPRGVIPVGGALSTPSLETIDEFGFDWALIAAEAVERSLREQPAATVDAPALQRPWHAGDSDLVLWPADRALSALLTEGARQPGGAAGAEAFIRALEWQALNDASRGDRALVIAVDALAALSGPPLDVDAFLATLHARLAHHPELEPTTPSQLASESALTRKLPAFAPGALGRWIGAPAQNDAWERLCAAKQLFDQCMAESSLDDAEQVRAERQLAACESADWFAWLGLAANDPRHAAARYALPLHLANLYRMLEEPVPAELDVDA